ncbi:lipid-binding SYLF domain-containing protein [Pseudodesulfovibrio piezophilus]|nr:lipid-binding SYLF domain-containing protein [Pseudodesulfovibrio piezophilus]
MKRMCISSPLGVLCSLLLLCSFSTLAVGCAGKFVGLKAVAAGQALVDSATETVRGELEGEQKELIAALVAKAKGIVILPEWGSVSFLYSLGGGNAVMLVRSEQGWRGPLFFAKGAGGLGLQAGITKTSGIIFYMNEEDVHYVLETGATLQGQASVILIDKEYQFNRTPEFFESGEVVFVGETQGMYAGVSLSGGGLSTRQDLNAAYHGVEDGNPEAILFGTSVLPEGARTLLDLLGTAESSVLREDDSIKTKKDETEVSSLTGSLGVSDGT